MTDAGRSFTARIGLAAALAVLTVPAAAEVGRRAEAPSVMGNAWGPFSFGMDRPTARRAAQAAGGKLTTVGMTNSAGTEIFAYRTAWQGDRDGTTPLIEFKAGRIARVVVSMFREAAPDAGTCMLLHEAALAELRGSERPTASLIGGTPPQPDATTWTVSLRQPGSRRDRVVVETNWEAPEDAVDAGSDDNCICVATYQSPG